MLAFLVETFWEIVKRVIPGNVKIPDWVDVMGSLAIGLLLAFDAKADLLALLGLQFNIPYLGIIITGLAISRGSNFMHDLIGSVSKIYQSKKNPPLTGEVLTISASEVPPNIDWGQGMPSNTEKVNPTAQESTHNTQI
jgi:hypothetical protein